MLVLQRKLGEKIVIDENIVVTVVEIRKGTVRFGIEAPKHVTVHRKEVYEAIQRAAESSTVAPVN
jgi:carbon storage regulator